MKYLTLKTVVTNPDTDCPSHLLIPMSVLQTAFNINNKLSYIEQMVENFNAIQVQADSVAIIDISDLEEHLTEQQLSDIDEGQTVIDIDEDIIKELDNFDINLEGVVMIVHKNWINFRFNASDDPADINSEDMTMDDISKASIASKMISNGDNHENR